MNDYNFFSSYQRKNWMAFDIRSPYFLGVLILIICAGFTAGVYVNNFITTMQINSMTAEVDTIKKNEDYIAADKFQKSLDAMIKYDASADLALKKFQSAQVLDSELISSLLKGVPTNVKVVSFGMDSTSFGITCNAPDRKVAAELLLGLKETGLCDDIQLNSVTSKEDGSGVVVSINGTLKVGQK